MLYHTVIFCMCSFNIHCVGHTDSVNREERKDLKGISETEWTGPGAAWWIWKRRIKNVKMTSGILAGIIRGMKMLLPRLWKQEEAFVCCVWSNREGKRKRTELEGYPGLACPKDICHCPPRTCPSTTSCFCWKDRNLIPYIIRSSLTLPDLVAPLNPLIGLPLWC